MNVLRLFVGLWLALACPALAGSYILKSGDLLRIEVMEDSGLNRTALILPDGTIAFPMVGQVRAAGLTLPQVREALISGLAPNFVQRPSLHVAVTSVGQPKAVARQASLAKPAPDKSMTVFGMGELAKPGKMQLPLGASLMQFLAQAGGTTPYAATKRVTVRRTAALDGAVTTYRVNVKQLMKGGGKSFVMEQGDVVIVPERKLFE